MNEGKVLVGRRADEDAIVARKPGVRGDRSVRTPHPDRQAGPPFRRVDQELGDQRANQATAEATKASPGRLDRPDDARIGSLDHASRHATNAARAGPEPRPRDAPERAAA